MSRPLRRGRVAAVVAAATLALAGCGSADPTPSAADQVPRLAAVLHRVDAALAAHRFAAARQYLKSLKTEVLTAREAGDLRETDATRVLDAISRLTATLPAATPTTSATPRPEAPTTTSSPRPTRSRSPRPT
jgi:outer membrane murein-binding lipoprotein Lpp